MGLSNGTLEQSEVAWRAGLGRWGIRIRLLEHPALVLPFLAGASSIASLLGYFYGLFSMRTGVSLVVVPGLLSAAAFVWLARRRGRADLADRVLGGIFAGGVATLFYDMCRIPLVHAGLPIFKAISYFGALIVGGTAVTAEAQLAGWAYHYSNGVGFALMYATLAVRDRLWTAVAWGVFLETAMLLTPYAEVFGYTRGREFLAITLGSHLVYGLGLWAGLRLWGRIRRPLPWRLVTTGFLLPALGVGLVGADFHRIHAEKLPPAPPAALGEHLHTTWNVLEVDRIITLWLVKRFIDPDARFALLPPFTRTPYGQPLDVPEAEIRRSGAKAAAEVAIERHSLDSDPALQRLGAIATHFEIHSWAAPPADARELGTVLREQAEQCGPKPDERCLDPLFATLDAWYRTGGSLNPSTGDEH